jgi:adenylate cyclase
VETHEPGEAAARAGVGEDYLDRLIELQLVETDANGGLTAGALRKVMLLHGLDEAGIPLEGLSQVVRRGEFSLDFIEAAGYDAFAPLVDVTFEQVHDQTGVPLDLLLAIREVTGGVPPRPTDRIREDELEIVPLIELQVNEGFRPMVIERTLRVYGDSLRRISETEGEWWRSEVQDKMLARGQTEGEVAAYAHQLSPRLSLVSEKAILAIYHAQQRLSWSANIVSGIAGALIRAGLHTRSEIPPAVCFLDITGYTRLTQERGDTAAAALAEQVARLVQRSSVQHGGRPVKWLGDGVMLYFPKPGPGVAAALTMLDGVTGAGLPPAHIGLHAGPILFQVGDIYGQTVNVAARIGEYARPGEVLVSQAVVDASEGEAVAFREIGPIELKGVSGVVTLHQAVRPT